MRGTLIFEDIGAGVWSLRTTDGKTFNLEGEIPRNLAGKTVIVDGDVQEGGGFGFAMQGAPLIWVRTIKAA